MLLPARRSQMGSSELSSGRTSLAKKQMAGREARPSKSADRFRLLGLFAQADHHVDAGDLVAGGRGGHLAHDLFRAGDIDQRVVAFDEEMVMRGGVGVEIG